MRRKLFILGTGVAIISICNLFVAAEEVPRITKQELKPMLDDPAVVILDVRAGRDWKGSEKKIKGAIRENPKRFESWARKYSKEKTLVLYCA